MKQSRNTLQRITVLQSVQVCLKHPSAEQVYLEAIRRLPSISRATVYRNLNLLCEQGMLKKIQSFSLCDRYDINTEVHHHFKCERCDEIYDINLCDIGITNNLTAENFLIKGQDLVLYGVCPKCNGK